ncbi:hypothetical protein [Rhodovulum sulfidophilum]|uniref:hypothetical protein n=1 Tax=Rhodovulum sulfidophilum TaxID=35806 RepID=UPI0012DAE114|nr:hypothetical protein [Rhodovulum sulfidophilum]MBL3561874.1 hypothetical protein [Rhodovulum sulfidophilum]MCW2304027.1 hypothetical protein [Rhodovulum sulfidophilum]
MGKVLGFRRKGNWLYVGLVLDAGLFAATAGKLRHCAAILRAIGELHALRHCHPDKWHSNFLIDESNMAAPRWDFRGIARSPDFRPSGDARRKRLSSFGNCDEQVGLPFSRTNFRDVDVKTADRAGL